MSFRGDVLGKAVIDNFGVNYRNSLSYDSGISKVPSQSSLQKSYYGYFYLIPPTFQYM